MFLFYPVLFAFEKIKRRIFKQEKEFDFCIEHPERIQLL